MFEGSLVESRGLVASKTQKWSTLGSLGVQCAIAALLIAIPMLRPEMLSVNVAPPRITLPQIKPAQAVQHIAQAATATAVALSVPATTVALEETHPRIFPGYPTPPDGSALPDGNGPIAMSDTNPLVVIAESGPRPAAATTTRPMRVSSGVSSGMLLSPIRPAYPAIAKIAGVQGTVVIEATISKAGRVETLHVVSGPEMLRNAATDAVRDARYAPYQLNGEPVEVQTTITVVFRLG